jgi:hypothetical protein
MTSALRDIRGRWDGISATNRGNITYLAIVFGVGLFWGVVYFPPLCILGIPSVFLCAWVCIDWAEQDKKIKELESKLNYKTQTLSTDFLNQLAAYKTYYEGKLTDLQEKLEKASEW